MPNSGKSKIALMFDGFDQGGIGRVNLMLAEEFLRLGFCVDLIVFDDSGPRRDQVPPKARVINLRRARRLDLFRHVFNYMRGEKKLSAIYVSSVLTAVYVSLAAKTLRSQTVIVGIHHVNIKQAFMQSRKCSISYVSIRHLVRVSNAYLGLHVATVSQGSKTSLSECTGIDLEAIRVLYNPVRLDYENTPPAGDAWQWWSAAGGPRLLTIGRLTPEKGHATLIEAIEILQDKMDVRLAIVGHGPFGETLEKLIAEKGLSDCIRLVGFIPNPRPYYEAADLYVQSSLSEAMSLTLVEALSVGTPVVSTDCDFGPRELLDYGKYGTLAPLSDPSALAEAIVIERDLRRERTFMVARASQFDPSEVAKRYLEYLVSSSDP